MILYAKYDGDNLVGYPYDLEDLREDYPNVSFPDTITFDVAKSFGVKKVEVDDVSHDELTEEPTYTFPAMVHKTLTEDDIKDDEGNFIGDYTMDNVGDIINTGRYSATKGTNNLPQDVAEANVRAKRDTLLSESDWVSLRAADRGQPTDAAWKSYREDLRNLTDQDGFPYSVTWPTKPA